MRQKMSALHQNVSNFYGTPNHLPQIQSATVSGIKNGRDLTVEVIMNLCGRSKDTQVKGAQNKHKSNCKILPLPFRPYIILTPSASSTRIASRPNTRRYMIWSFIVTLLCNMKVNYGRLNKYEQM